MSEQDFGEFTIETTRKPVAGVTAGVIPAGLAALLAEHAPKALTDPDFELTLTAKDEATAKKLAAYSRAWGAQQEPKLYIHKVPNRRDMTNNVARLAVELDAEVKPENRPGRRNPK
jgi:uncharacterized protein YbjT (DUF2867 family)